VILAPVSAQRRVWSRVEAGKGVGVIERDGAADDRLSRRAGDVKIRGEGSSLEASQWEVDAGISLVNRNGVSDFEIDSCGRPLV
jgi:hypothetical protein